MSSLRTGLRYLRIASRSWRPLVPSNSRRISLEYRRAHIKPYLVFSAIAAASILATADKVYLDVTQPNIGATNPSGTSVPDFPVYRRFNSSSDRYELLGIGIRKVTFIGVEAYVLGLYIPSSAILLLSQLSSSYEENDSLFEALIARTSMAAVIVPVRNTDLAHIRDGFIRSVIARRNQEMKEKKLVSTEEISAYRDKIDAQLKLFKEQMPHQKLKKAEQLVLITNAESKDIVLELEGQELCRWDGDSVKDLSRLIFRSYLVGDKVVCEQARESSIKRIKRSQDLQTS